jgi:hypothetical protein
MCTQHAVAGGHNAYAVHTSRSHLECLCCASPPDADCQLARPAVCQHVSSGCADGLDTGAAAPLARQGIIRIIQLPAPEPVHVGQGCGRGTTQACRAHTHSVFGVKICSGLRPQQCPCQDMWLYLGCELDLHRCTCVSPLQQCMLLISVQVLRLCCSAKLDTMHEPLRVN